MKLMAILLLSFFLTTTPSFAESILSELFSGNARSVTEADRAAHAEREKRISDEHEAISSACKASYPNWEWLPSDREAAGRCFYDTAMQRMDMRSQVYRQQQQDRQRAYDANLEAAQMQAAGMILQGFALRPLIPTMQPYNPPPLPAFVPSPIPRSLPPVSCSTNVVGGVAQTNCY